MAQLKKDGTVKRTPNNKRQGVKSEVYAFTEEEYKAISDYFISNNSWDYYLVLHLSINLGLRISDMLSLRWWHFYNPATGDFREDLYTVKEKKTGKLNSPHISEYVEHAIRIYLSQTDCDPSEDNYSGFVFAKRHSLTYRGQVMDQATLRIKLKKVAKELDIKKNVGCHSLRKTFGSLLVHEHPGDPLAMEHLRSIFNHSSVRITAHYIGDEKKDIDKYYDDIGSFCLDYIEGDKPLNTKNKSAIVSLYNSDLYELINLAFHEGQNSALATNSEVVDTITTLHELIDTLKV